MQNRFKLELTAPGGGVVDGAVYLIGALVVVATATVAEGERFTGFIGPGLITYAKPGSQAWTEGAVLYWDDSAKVFTTTAGSNTVAGVAAAAVGSGAGETTGTIRLSPTLASGGGPGGESLLHQATVTLTDAQIKALPTTAVEVIAEPAANHAILPLHASLFLAWVADYTNIAATSEILILLGVQAMTGLYEDESLGQVSQLLAPGEPDAGALMFPFARLHQGSDRLAGHSDYTSSIYERPLAIVAQNALSGNYMGGNAANTLRVSVAYFLLNTLTGEYV